MPGLPKTWTSASNSLLWHCHVILKYASCVLKESLSLKIMHPRDVTKEKFPQPLGPQDMKNCFGLYPVFEALG